MIVCMQDEASQGNDMRTAVHLGICVSVRVRMHIFVSMLVSACASDIKGLCLPKAARD